MQPRPGKHWERERFFQWLWPLMTAAEPPIPHLHALALAAGLHPSTLSNWKRGKTRPTLDTLSAIAQVLGREAQEAWTEAGVLEARGPARLDDADPSDWAAAMIAQSHLGSGAKQRLLELHRADMANIDEQQRSRLASLIKLWEP